MGAARIVLLVGSVLLEVFFPGEEGFLWEFSASFPLEELASGCFLKLLP